MGIRSRWRLQLTPVRDRAEFSKYLGRYTVEVTVAHGHADGVTGHAPTQCAWL